jgi:hypothetical protein
MTNCRCQDAQKNIKHRFGSGRWGEDACQAFRGLAQEVEIEVVRDGGQCRCKACGRIICCECMLWGMNK